VNRTLALLFFSGLAYAYEEVRTLATSWMGQLLREKEITNVSLRKATKARTRFLSNMSHGTTTPSTQLTLPLRLTSFHSSH